MGIKILKNPIDSLPYGYTKIYNHKDDEERMWAENEILIGNRELIVHSNAVGDYIGEVTKVSNLTWLDADSE